MNLFGKSCKIVQKAGTLSIYEVLLEILFFINWRYH